MAVWTNANVDTSTWEVWCDTLEDIMSMQTHRESNYRAFHVTRPGWYGVRSRTEADQLMNTGWPEGAAVARELGAQLNAPRLQNVRRVRRKSDFGDAVDMQMVYSGQLDRAWDKTQREISPSKAGNALTIAVNLNTSAYHDPRDFVWTGAVATRLTDLLVQSGRSVRVLGYATTHDVYDGRNQHQLRHCDTAFVAKEYTEPTDLGRLMAVLGHAAMFRVYCFAAWTSYASHANAGLGRVLTFLSPLVERREARATILDVQRVYDRTAAQHLLSRLLTEVTGGES